jgi:hypothetical protein
MKSKIFLSVIFLLFSIQTVTSQETKPKASISASQKITYYRMIIRTAPKFTLQLSIGYNHGIYELAGNDNGDFNSLQFYNGENFGVRHRTWGNFNG